MRTDTHRPAVIKPDEYFEIGWLYLGPDPYLAAAFRSDRECVKRVMSENGYRWSRHEHGGTCGICGALAFTLGVFVHRPTGEAIKVGEDCARKMELQAGSLFRVAKSKLDAERKAKAGKLKAQAILDRLGIGAAWAWYAGEDKRLEEFDREMGKPEMTVAYPAGDRPFAREGWQEWERKERAFYDSQAEHHAAVRAWRSQMRQVIGQPWRSLDRACHILGDMIDKLIRYGSWSEAQERLAVKLWTEIDSFPAKVDEYRAAADKLRAERAAIEITEGRQVIEGKILSMKERETDYGLTIKILVERDDGAKLWGTCPAAILDAERGDAVRFKATVKPREPGFAFYSRPAAAEVVN